MTEQIAAPESDDGVDRIDRGLLLRIAQERDVAAMKSLYERFDPKLRRFMRRLTSDRDLIDEAYNDVMVIVWKKAGQYAGNSKVSSWIYTIAYRSCLQLIKRNKRRDTMFELVDDDELASVKDGSQPGLEGNAELAAAVRALSSKQRIVIELCYFEGYSLQEISQIVNCPLNTVKTRLHHARKRIRELLEEARQSLESSSGEGGLL
ncbi:MAG: RNA polymerase sigma factor [Pseudomonadota bacterium]